MMIDLQTVMKLASELHDAGQPWNGEAFGWPAEYNPERPEPPLDSNMTFTPADPFIGESGIWFFSLMWEHGSDAEPVELLDNKGYLEERAGRANKEKFLAAMAKVADLDPLDERDRWISMEAHHLTAVLDEPKVPYETHECASQVNCDDEEML